MNGRVSTCSGKFEQRNTGSITPFGVGQKVNIIVTLVEIMVTFCRMLSEFRILLDNLLFC